MSAVATLATCANDAQVNFARPNLSQLHTGRSLTWFAIEQGFRSVKEMLMEVEEILVSEANCEIYVQKKLIQADEAPNRDEGHSEDS